MQACLGGAGPPQSATSWSMSLPRPASSPPCLSRFMWCETIPTARRISSASLHRCRVRCPRPPTCVLGTRTHALLHRVQRSAAAATLAVTVTHPNRPVTAGARFAAAAVLADRCASAARTPLGHRRGMRSRCGSTARLCWKGATHHINSTMGRQAPGLLGSESLAVLADGACDSGGTSAAQVWQSR